MGEKLLRRFLLEHSVHFSVKNGFISGAKPTSRPTWFLRPFHSFCLCLYFLWQWFLLLPPPSSQQPNSHRLKLECCCVSSIILLAVLAPCSDTVSTEEQVPHTYLLVGWVNSKWVKQDFILHSCHHSSTKLKSRFSLLWLDQKVSGNISFTTNPATSPDCLKIFMDTKVDSQQNQNPWAWERSTNSNFQMCCGRF